MIFVHDRTLVRFTNTTINQLPPHPHLLGAPPRIGSRLKHMKLWPGTGVLALTCALIAGLTDGQSCDTSGGSSEYTESFLNTNYNINNWRRRITVASCPNHNNVKTSSSESHDAQRISVILEIPANPTLQATSTRVDLTSTGMTIGLTLNGVAIRSCYSSIHGECTDFSTSAANREGATIDDCSGHADSSGV